MSAVLALACPLLPSLPRPAGGPLYRATRPDLDPHSYTHTPSTERAISETCDFCFFSSVHFAFSPLLVLGPMQLPLRTWQAPPPRAQLTLSSRRANPGCSHRMMGRQTGTGGRMFSPCSPDGGLPRLRRTTPPPPCWAVREMSHLVRCDLFRRRDGVGRPRLVPPKVHEGGEALLSRTLPPPPRPPDQEKSPVVALRRCRPSTSRGRLVGKPALGVHRGRRLRCLPVSFSASASLAR